MESMKSGLLRGLIIALKNMEDNELNKEKIIGILELIILEDLRQNER